MNSPRAYISSWQIRPNTCRLLLAAACLAGGSLESRAQLGLPHECYGVWDRGGFNTVAAYPFTRGQEYVNTWLNVNSARHTFDWSSLDAQLQFADSQNENLIIQIQPVGGSSSGVPPWILAANGGGVAQYTDNTYTYGDYRDLNYRQYYTEMVQALAYHVRQDPALAANLRARIAFVRVDTGATGDEVPYQNDAYVLANYPLLYVDKNTQEWIDFRKWAFEVYRAAFQDGAGPVVPMLYQAVDNISNVQEWNWVVANVHGGFGAKFGGNGRGHHLTNSDDVPAAYKSFTVNPAGSQLFTRNEMDNTFLQPYFQLNIGLSMYWAAVEQLNAGMSIWDVNLNCMQDSYSNAHNYSSVFQFFNQWAAEVIPATARGGFCIFHKGLDSQDSNTFKVADYGNYPATQYSTARYTAICQAYSAQGAQMDDLNGATLGSNAQRGNSPGMIGFNDSGWNIVPGNYERFITQLDPDNTSKALWRVGTATSGPTKGIISSTAPPYDRFARRSDTASGKNTMYFDIQNNLLPTPGQAVQINVTYRNDTAGQFLIKYDAVGDTLKTLTVNKTGLGTGANIWATASFVVTDWFFGNRQPTNTAPSGSDLQLVNVGPGDTIYHGIELVKRGSVTVSTQGQGTVNARNDSWIYSPLLSGPLDQGMRLDLSATPAQGWEFDSWLNDLAGKTKPIVFVGENTQIAAKFKYNGIFTSEDNFDSGTWTGGSYWTGPWTLTGTATAGATVQLTGNAANFSQITRSLSTPIPNATLTFDWDLDRIATNQPGTVEVFDTVTNAWKQVWSYSVKGGDPDASAQLVTATINLSAYVVSGVRFTLNANGSTARFWLDNVKITGIIP